MTGIVLRYKGRILLRGTQGETASELDTLRAPVASTDAIVEHTIASDGSVEILRYTLGGRLLAVVYRDAKSCSFITSQPDQLTVHPPEESGGFPTLGYIQTPDASSVLTRRASPKERDANDAGCSETPGCTDLRVPIHFNAKVYPASWRPGAATITASPYRYEGRPFVLLAWNVVPEAGRLYARTVEFRETDPNGGIVAQASYILVEARKIATIPERAAFVRPGSGYQIEKDHHGFGGAYDPNVRDEWALYRRYERLWAREDAKNTAPWGGIGVGLVATAALAAIALRKWTKR